MKKLFDISAKLKSDKGVTAVYVAIMLVVFIGMIALAVDVGYMMVARNASQNAADAAALAGARRLGENYYVPVSPVSSNVTTVAQNTASRNKVAGQNLAVDNVAIRIGTWTPPFAETSVYPNAVWAEVKREEGLANGAIDTFFARVLGINNYKMAATACAAISGTCEAVVGLPLGIGTAWFLNDSANRGCKQIAVNATKSSCAGWTNLSPTKKYDHKDVEDMLKDPTKIPEVNVGDRDAFNGGTTQKVVDALDALFRDKEKFKAQKTFDARGHVLTWTTSLVVFQDNGICENPNKNYEIVGFATITITDVIRTGNAKGPVGEVQCNQAVQERGGCFFAGTYGAIPGLVK